MIDSIYIEGRTGTYEKLAGVRPDFYNAIDEEVLRFLEWGAAKVNGMRLDRLEHVLKIIDIFKK